METPLILVGLSWASENFHFHCGRPAWVCWILSYEWQHVCAVCCRVLKHTLRETTKHTWRMKMSSPGFLLFQGKLSLSFEQLKACSLPRSVIGRFTALSEHVFSVFAFPLWTFLKDLNLLKQTFRHNHHTVLMTWFHVTRVLNTFQSAESTQLTA